MKIYISQLQNSRWRTIIANGTKSQQKTAIQCISMYHSKTRHLNISQQNKVTISQQTITIAVSDSYPHHCAL